MYSRKYLKYLFIVLLISACVQDDDIIDDDGNTEDPLSEFPIEEDALAFPGAEGFGKEVTGGRGGKVIYVTTLADGGPGSLRAALLDPNPRYILFKVSGNIELNSPLNIGVGNVTIAGQSAPGDGITITNHPVRVMADNVIIRFLRFRMGDLGAEEADALEGRYRKNIIIDHCSMSWSTDECSSFYGNENFTMQWCILSESLRNSVHDKGAHGYGGIWGGNNATFHHNLLAHHDNRNPRFDHPGVYQNEGQEQELRGTVDFRNNVIYNWGTDASYGGERGTFNMVANYYKPGPASLPRRRILNAYRQASSSSPVYGYGKFFVADNYLDGAADITENNWIGVVAKDGSVQDKNNMRLEAPLAYEITSIHTAEQAYEAVLRYAGASYARDAVDERIINDVENGTYLAEGSNGSTNGIIDSQEDVGGWPELKNDEPLIDSSGDGMPDAWKIEMGLDPDKYEANGNDLSTAYDNVEVYINSLVKHIMIPED